MRRFHEKIKLPIDTVAEFLSWCALHDVKYQHEVSSYHVQTKLQTKTYKLRFHDKSSHMLFKLTWVGR